MKKIIALLLVLVIIAAGIVIYMISKNGSNNDSSSNSINTDTGSITTNGKTTTTAKNKSAETRTDSIGEWTYNIPASFKDVKSDGPAYEKTYSDDKSTVLDVSCHEPQETDNRSDEQIFSAGFQNLKSGIKQSYGDGKFLSEKSDTGNKSYITYYQTSNKTIMIKYILKNKTWYIITFEVPSGVDTKNYESVLDNFKAK